MTNPAGSFIWYELMTSDPSGAKAFYDAVVGWNIDAEQVAPDVDYRMIKRGDGGNAGGVLRLTDEMQSHGARPMWLGYLSTPDVDATMAAIEAAGGKTLMPPWNAPGVGRLAMFADPQGAPVYLMAPLPREGQPEASSDVFSVDQPHHVRWNELSTEDPAAAIAFYTGQFGWGQEGEMEMPVQSDVEGGEFGAYRFLQHGGVAIGAVMGRMPGSPANAWTYYIGVDDIDRAASAVTGNGGIIIQEPIEIPGGEFSLVAVDPQGAPFALVGPRL